MNVEPRKPDISHLKDLADAAHELGDNKAYTQAVLNLRKRWHEELLDVAAEEVLLVRERIKALEAINKELTVLMNDYKMAKRNA